MTKLVQVILSDEELILTEDEWYQIHGKPAKTIEQEIKEGKNKINSSEVKKILEKHPNILQLGRKRQKEYKAE
ncbi:MAG TPA: hypothetical protein VK111_08865 [Virgibacillus sp.]|nr:hypothetical protein [Virgibacillus sp.]